MAIHKRLVNIATHPDIFPLYSLSWLPAFLRSNMVEISCILPNIVLKLFCIVIGLSVVDFCCLTDIVFVNLIDQE